MKTPHCRICDEFGHYAITCRKRINKPIKTTRQLKSAGKHHRLWKATRKQWFELHVQDHYQCHYCGKWLTKNQTTLDHRFTRSSHPQLRYDLDNLIPCCLLDNNLRGSRSYESFCEQYYPHLLSQV